jgi:hypothetical protein
MSIVRIITTPNAGTIAINVGGPEPFCDTFVSAGKKGGVRNVSARVGACKVEDCTFNNALECTAESIRVTLQQNRAQCVSYQLRN